MPQQQAHRTAANSCPDDIHMHLDDEGACLLAARLKADKRGRAAVIGALPEHSPLETCGMIAPGAVVVEADGRWLVDDPHDSVVTLFKHGVSNIVVRSELSYYFSHATAASITFDASPYGEIEGYLKVRAQAGVPGMRPWILRYFKLHCDRSGWVLSRYQSQKNAESGASSTIIPMSQVQRVVKGDSMRVHIHMKDHAVHKLEAASPIEQSAWAVRLATTCGQFGIPPHKINHITSHSPPAADTHAAAPGTPQSTGSNGSSGARVHRMFTGGDEHELNVMMLADEPLTILEAVAAENAEVTTVQDSTSILAAIGGLQATPTPVAAAAPASAPAASSTSSTPSESQTQGHSPSPGEQHEREGDDAPLTHATPAHTTTDSAASSAASSRIEQSGVLFSPAPAPQSRGGVAANSAATPQYARLLHPAHEESTPGSVDTPDTVRRLAANCLFSDAESDGAPTPGSATASPAPPQ